MRTSTPGSTYSSAFSDKDRFAGERLIAAFKAAAQQEEKNGDVALSSVAGVPLKTESNMFDDVGVSSSFRQASIDNDPYFKDWQARARAFDPANGFAPPEPQTA